MRRRSPGWSRNSRSRLSHLRLRLGSLVRHVMRMVRCAVVQEDPSRVFLNVVGGQAKTNRNLQTRKPLEVDHWENLESHGTDVHVRWHDSSPSPGWNDKDQQLWEGMPEWKHKLAEESCHLFIVVQICLTCFLSSSCSSQFFLVELAATGKFGAGRMETETTCKSRLKFFKLPSEINT